MARNRDSRAASSATADRVAPKVVDRAANPTTVPYTPILATLGYALSADRRKVLLVHRNARADDAHLGKYNGLGGKLEPLEDVVAGMRRELFEEAGIECIDLGLRGTISWPGFGKHGEDWFGFIFVISQYRGCATGTQCRRARWSGSTSSASPSCPCGKATAISCRWSSTPTRGLSTG